MKFFAKLDETNKVIAVHCVCDTDVRHWQSMNNRDLYWNHNTDGFDCDCDDCEKFRNDKSNWEESK